MSSKDKRLLQQVFNSLRDSQKEPREFYRIEREKIDFIKNYQKMKNELKILTAKVTAFEALKEKKTALICDIDGCIIDTSNIWKMAKLFNVPENKYFEFFYQHANGTNNQYCMDCIEFVNNFKKFVDKVIFITARSEKLRIGTFERLKNVVNCDFDLLMRPVDNVDEPSILKEQILKEVNKNYVVLLAIDDDDNICSMYKNNGIATINWKIKE